LVDGLVQASARAALLVVGRARRTGSGATTSVADQVAQRSEAPVIIVPPVWATPGRTRCVTVGVDQPGHARLLEEAFRAAALERGEVTILHVWHPGGLEEAALARIGGPDWYPIEECQLRERLEKSVAAAAQRFPGIRHTVEMEPALRAPAETLAEASEWSVLVVVGRRDPAFDGDETVIGSAVSGLLDLALCPVLVVPATTLGPGPASRPTATEEPVGHQA
jgi:nucleotide-binding universal stress UspA family protein